MIRGAATWAALSAIAAYRVVLGPLLGGACRFQPSCSEYATEAIRVHGSLRGTALAFRRLSRCHPLGTSFGFDPVPPTDGAISSRQGEAEAVGLKRS